MLKDNSTKDLNILGFSSCFKRKCTKIMFGTEQRHKLINGENRVGGRH